PGRAERPSRPAVGRLARREGDGQDAEDVGQAGLAPVRDRGRVRIAMEYFWKENKRFVLMVGGGLAFLILYQSLVLGKIRAESDAAERTRRNKKSDIERKMAQGVPTDEALVAGRRDRDLNRKVLASMVPDTAFVLPERFQKPKRDVKAYYDNLRI